MGDGLKSYQYSVIGKEILLYLDSPKSMTLLHRCSSAQSREHVYLRRYETCYRLTAHS